MPLFTSALGAEPQFLYVVPLVTAQTVGTYTAPYFVPDSVTSAKVGSVNDVVYQLVLKVPPAS